MFFTNLLRIHFLFHEFTFNPLSFSRFEYSLSSLSIFASFFANSIRNHHLFRVFTCTSYQTFANLLSIQNKFSIVFKNTLLIPYLCKLTSNSLFFVNLFSIQYLYLELTWNALSCMRIDFPFTFYFANSNWIQFLFHVFIFNSLSFPRQNFEFTIYFANSRGIPYLFFELTFNSISFLQTHY